MAAGIDNVTEGYEGAIQDLQGGKTPKEVMDEPPVGTGGTGDKPGARAKQMGRRRAAADWAVTHP
jgi:hypothetical protein